MSQTQPYDVLLLGDYFFDVIYSGLGEFPVLGREIYSTKLTSTGGAMFITAAALRRLEVRVGWAGQFGNDEYSHFVIDLARQERIDLSLARFIEQPYRHITTSLPFQGERAFVTFIDPDPDDWFAYWMRVVSEADYRHLHLGSLLCIEKAEPLFEIAHAHGATISMDCQDVELLRQGCDWKKLLGMVDVFLPNAREAKLIAKKDTVREALSVLREWVDQVVIKDGSNGAWVSDGDGIAHIECVYAGDVIDTTGAGDCFNAGYLYGTIVKGESAVNAARCGNICGGLSVTGVGGATNAPTLEELTQWDVGIKA